MTYKQARVFLLAYLSRQGWTVKGDLKTPYATSPDGEVRFWFRPQAVHFTTAPHSYSTAHTLDYELDIREITPEEFLSAYEPRVRRVKVRKQSLERELAERRELRKHVEQVPFDDSVLLPQIDKQIEEGGGWAKMSRLPGGEDAIWRLIQSGILEESGGFVRRGQPKKAPMLEQEIEERQSPEKKAEFAILRWCRSYEGKRAVGGHPVMRDVRGVKMVLDVDRTEAVPGSAWERRSVTHAEGATWQEVLEKLEQRFGPIT